MLKGAGRKRRSKSVFLGFPSKFKAQIKDRAAVLDIPVNRYLRGLARADLARSIGKRRAKQIAISKKPGDNHVAFGKSDIPRNMNSARQNIEHCAKTSSRRRSRSALTLQTNNTSNSDPQ